MMSLVLWFQAVTVIGALISAMAATSAAMGLMLKKRPQWPLSLFPRDTAVCNAVAAIAGWGSASAQFVVFVLLLKHGF